MSPKPHLSPLLLCALACCCWPAWLQAADDRTAPNARELANANTIGLLAQAREALAKLDNPQPDDSPEQRKIYFDTAADSLTTLYQLHGCAWAAPELESLYARPDAPQLRIGHSPDGRVQLRVEPLPLQNPVFDDYTVLLCTFTSLTARDVVSNGPARLELTLPDGSWAGAHLLEPGHALWPHLQRIAAQFSPPPELPSGAGVAFKQLYGIPRFELPLNSCALSLTWGGYVFDMPCWTSAQENPGDG